ncbi:hypothetical protein [Piscinibacter sakaiensis]|uniref:hypothetical protein n=1 Tax=Piscinibacter sakaiensis TaxID=1547922 RepID=UPI003AABDA1E
MPFEAAAAAIDASALAQTLRASIWLYPLVNTGHVVGIALLFGAIVPLDLRLLGRRRVDPLDQLARTLIPVALIGLLLAASTGTLLFVTRPLDYIGEPLFGIKLLLIGCALLNAALLHRSAHWRLTSDPIHEPLRLSWRLAGLLSIALWLAVIAAGRLIGYR